MNTQYNKKYVLQNSSLETHLSNHQPNKFNNKERKKINMQFYPKGILKASTGGPDCL